MVKRSSYVAPTPWAAQPIGICTNLRGEDIPGHRRATAEYPARMRKQRERKKGWGAYFSSSASRIVNPMTLSPSSSFMIR
ncbi:MAG TPA: hypothetical protein PLI76_03660, partial [Methanoculleus sp.]|nr:hypothetical protein [Methanoculleus sp.]